MTQAESQAWESGVQQGKALVDQEPARFHLNDSVEELVGAGLRCFDEHLESSLRAEWEVQLNQMRAAFGVAFRNGVLFALAARLYHTQRESEPGSGSSGREEGGRR